MIKKKKKKKKNLKYSLWSKKKIEIKILTLQEKHCSYWQSFKMQHALFIFFLKVFVLKYYYHFKIFDS